MISALRCRLLRHHAFILLHQQHHPTPSANRSTTAPTTEIITIDLVLSAGSFALEPVGAGELRVDVPVGDDKPGMDGKPARGSALSVSSAAGLPDAVCFAPFVTVARRRTSSEVVPHVNETKVVESLSVELRA